MGDAVALEKLTPLIAVAHEKGFIEHRDQCRVVGMARSLSGKARIVDERFLPEQSAQRRILPLVEHRKVEPTIVAAAIDIRERIRVVRTRLTSGDADACKGSLRHHAVGPQTVGNQG